MKKNELISYALSFAAFLLMDSQISATTTKIILFGSVARGDFDDESDVDIFIETKSKDEKIQKHLELFNKSKIRELYDLKGLKNEIALKIGSLDKWKGLSESIEEDGIAIYAKYEAAPESLNHFTLFKISAENRKFSSKIKLWRAIYGHKQRVGKKVYESRGLLRELGCTRVSKGAFIAPFHHRQKILDFLDKNKVSYEMFDIYKKLD